jgi:hypothetical protein
MIYENEKIALTTSTVSTYARQDTCPKCREIRSTRYPGRRGYLVLRHLCPFHAGMSDAKNKGKAFLFSPGPTARTLFYGPLEIKI